MTTQHIFSRALRQAALCISVSLLAAPAQAQWQQTTGPGSNMVADIVAHNNALYLGTQGGIYRSTDQGSTWTYTSQSISHDREQYYLLSTPQTLVTGSDNGIHRSTDGGQTWQQLASGYMDVNDLTQNATSLFAATDGLGIQRSDDQALTWIDVNFDANGNRVVPPIVDVVTAHGPFVLASGNQSLLRTADNGSNWQVLSHSSIGLPQPGSINSISSVDSQVFAGVFGAGVFVSNDNGNSFTAVNNGLPPAALYSVQHVFRQGQALLAGLMGQALPVYRSTDGGQTWTASSTGMSCGDGVTRFFSEGGHLFASTARGLYTSTDDGLTWQLTNKGITNGFVDALAANSTYLFAGLAERGTGGTQSMYRSADNGQTWEAINTGMTQVQVKALYATDQVVLVGGNNQTLYRSTDNGTTWTNVGLTAPMSSDAVGIVAAGSSLFLITDNDGVFRSTDLGLTWTAVTNASTMNPLGYAIGSDGTNLYAAAGMNTYQSTDGGTTWTNTGSISASTWGTAFHSFGHYVYMGTRHQGIYRRPKNGTTWTQMNAGLGNISQWITALASHGDSLFASTDYSSTSFTGAIYLSTDSGSTWTLYNQGLPANIGVRALLVHDDKLFAGTGSLYNNDGRSVWYRPMSAFLTAEAAHTGAAAATVFPNPFSSSATIGFTLEQEAQVTLQVYDLLGRPVASRPLGLQSAGVRQVQFDAGALPSGLYTYCLCVQTGGHTTQLKGKMMLSR